MAFIEGTATGMGGLIDTVRDFAVANGWSVLRDTQNLYNYIPTDLESIQCSVVKTAVQGYFDGNDNTVGTATSFTLTLPYYLKPTGYKLHGTGTFALSVSAVDTDLSSTLIVDNATVATDSGVITATKGYTQYNFTVANPANVKEINLFFDTTIAQSRELILYSTGFGGDDNIYIGFKGFTLPSGAQNVAVSTFTGFAALAAFEVQSNHCANMFLHLHEKDIKYWLSANKGRILGGLGIFEPLDAQEKNPVYQFLHLGYLTAYGMPSQLPAPYAILAGGQVRTARWSDVNTTLPLKPMVFTPYPHYIIADSLVDSFTLANTPYQHDSTASLFALPLSLFSTAETTLLGEFDGYIKVLATNQTKSEDVITIDGEDYTILQNGKKLSLIDFFAIRRT
jgi:hypothetical protein